MLAPLRQRVVDDTDAEIQYGGEGWFVAVPSTLGDGNFGPIFNDTAHGTMKEDAVMSFEFNGTAISVWGTINVSTDPVTNITDPSWTCFIDDIPISQPNPTFQFPENNWELCGQPQLTAGPHNLTIQVTSSGRAFYLDYLVYTPLPGDTWERSVLIYENTDPAVSFGTGWDTFGGENATDVPGSQVALNFHGTSVTMLGFVPTERPHNATWATYSLDGGPPINFTLKGLMPGNASNVATKYNVALFTTRELESATHNLVVIHGGDNQHTPLVLQKFYVVNTTDVSSPSAASSASSVSPPSASGSATSLPAMPTSTSSAGAIAGGVIGGFVLLSLLALLGLCLIRRQRRRIARERASTSATPFPMSMSPSVAPPIPYAFMGPPPHRRTSAPGGVLFAPASVSNFTSFSQALSNSYSNSNSQEAQNNSTPNFTSHPASSGSISRLALPPTGSQVGSSRTSTSYPYASSYTQQAPLHQHPSDTMSSAHSHSYTRSLSFSRSHSPYPQLATRSRSFARRLSDSVVSSRSGDVHSMAANTSHVQDDDPAAACPQPRARATQKPRLSRPKLVLGIRGPRPPSMARASSMSAAAGIANSAPVGSSAG